MPDFLEDPTPRLVERIRTDVKGAARAIRDIADAGGPDRLMGDPYERPLKCLDAAIADLNLLLGPDEDRTEPRGGGGGRRRRSNPDA